MKVVSIFIIFTIFAFNLIACNEPKNPEELEESEDWQSIADEICKINDNSGSIKQQIEECQKIDPYYKFDSLTKQCDKLRAPPGSPWFDEEKSECKYQACYTKLTKSKEFLKLRKETENLDEDERIKKGYQKYCCIRRVLGLKECEKTD